MTDRSLRPSRRTLLVVGGTVLVGAGLFARQLYRAVADRQRVRERARGRLLSFFDRPEQVRPVGQSYIESHPEEADRDRLVDLLLEEIGDPADVDSDQRLSARIAAVVREEFDADRTVVLENWVVSRTEARLAALTIRRLPGFS